MKRIVPALRLFGAGLMILAAASTAHASANLLANPGFETASGSYTGYFTFGSGVQLSKPATDNIIHTGSCAAKIYGGFTGCPATPAFNVGGFGQAFTNPPVGLTYTFSGYSFISSADAMVGSDPCNRNRCIAKLVFFNALSGGAEIESDEYVIGDASTPTDQWIPFLVSAVVPTGAKRVEADILYLQPACDAGSVFVDDLRLVSNPTPSSTPNLLANASFSSGLTGWTTFGNVFADTRALAVKSLGGSIKMFSTFVIDAPSGVYQSFTSAPGRQYLFEINARNTCQDSPITGTNDNYGLARIVFRDASHNEISSQDVLLADHTSPLGTYVTKSVTATAPAGTATVEPYVLFISPTLQGGALFFDDVRFRQLETAGVPQTPQAAALELAAPAPNPSRGTTRVDYSLAHSDGDVDVTVYDITGRHVATLQHGALAAGPHSTVWDGRDAQGHAVANGMYRVVVRTSGTRATRSIVIAR